MNHRHTYELYTDQSGALSFRCSHCRRDAKDIVKWEGIFEGAVEKRRMRKHLVLRKRPARLIYGESAFNQF